MKSVCVVEANNINGVPPSQNVVKALLHNGYKVQLVTIGIDTLPKDILEDVNFQGFEIPFPAVKGIFTRAVRRYNANRYMQRQVAECMKSCDFLWTASMMSIIALGDTVLKYKHIFELLELERYRYSYRYFRHSLDKIAQHAFKLVVPEINRAYIEKIWWDLDVLPTILPNKPYNLETGQLTEDVARQIERVKSENRNVILYLGGIWEDRNLDLVAKVIQSRQDMALYIVGGVAPGKEKTLNKLVNDYSAVYLGKFNPPQHLNFVKYAYMGLLPYKPTKALRGVSEVNSLYCAPNKIYEYSGFGVPMIGSDVLGLKLPFEKWDIGRCYDENSEQCILNALDYVDANHDAMSKNCYDFYNDTDLDTIVKGILED